MFWFLLFLYVGTTVLSGLLQRGPSVKASALGELQVPTAEDGRNLPVFWGTCCLKAPNVVWYGDYKVTAIKKSKGWLSFGATYTAGYRYHLGMDLALCHGPADELVDVLAGTGGDLKSINFSEQSTNPDGSKKILVDDYNCFGGEDKEGGIRGWGTFYYGSNTQDSDGYMSNQLGITYPAYRGVCHLVCDQWYLGTQQYIKNLALVLRRTPSNLGLSAGQSNINGDANPAEILYECLNVKAWALGFAAGAIDTDSFYDAGVTLFSEGFGISMVLDSPKQADKLIETILQHIDAVLYTDPETGLWTLKLIRPDYDPGSLAEYGEDSIAECEFSRGSWEDTVNEVKVIYTDRDTWKQATVQAQEGANFAIRQGELETKTFDFSGFSSAAIAQKVCNRELRTHSYPVGKGRIKVNRKAWALRMGSPFKLTWPALGIDQMPVRVTSIDYGSLKDGMMEMEICEDVFKANYTAYGPPSGSGWTDPIDSDPAAVSAQMPLEAPYQLLDALTQPRILIAAARGDGISLGYEVWGDEGSGYRHKNTMERFCAAGQLAAAYSRKTDPLDAAGFTLSGVDLGDLVGTDETGRDSGENLLIFADTGEICAWQGIIDNGDGSYTLTNIVRGVYDTFPEDHSAGTWVFILSNATLDGMGDYESQLLLDTGDDSIILND